MSCRLSIQMHAEPGALLRLLIAVSKRNFEVVALRSERVGGFVSVDLTVDGERPAENLARTIERLFDVERVQVLS